MDLFKEKRGLKWDGTHLHFIEQTLLPGTREVITTNDWRVVVDAIKRLAIRGAPAIGVAGAYACVLAYDESAGNFEIYNQFLEKIRTARPTAVNLAWAVDRIKNCGVDEKSNSFRDKIKDEANAIAKEDEEMCIAMADFGVELIPEDSTALTHCNTGFLVTAGIGTALGVLGKAHEAGLLKEVFACEARPLRQGSRLTMWELDLLGIPGKLLCDSAVGRLMQEGLVDFVMLGADRIAGNGDTANKIGTYNLAVLAKKHSIPLYVVAPTSTIDCSISTGKKIPIEYRHEDEVRNIDDKLSTIPEAQVYNPAIDVTPNELITAIVCEKGICYPPYNL